MVVPLGKVPKTWVTKRGKTSEECFCSGLQNPAVRQKFKRALESPDHQPDCYRRSLYSCVRCTAGGVLGLYDYFQYNLRLIWRSLWQDGGRPKTFTTWNGTQCTYWLHGVFANNMLHILWNKMLFKNRLNWYQNHHIPLSNKDGKQRGIVQVSSVMQQHCLHCPSQYHAIYQNIKQICGGALRSWLNNTCGNHNAT